MALNDTEGRMWRLAEDLALLYKCQYEKDFVNLVYIYHAAGRPDLVVTMGEMREASKVTGNPNRPLLKRFRDWADGKETVVAQAKGRSALASDILLSLSGESLDVRKDDEGNVRVSYHCADVKDGIGLVGIYGRGANFEYACKDYLKQIRGKTLVFDAESPSRREVMVLG